MRSESYTPGHSQNAADFMVQRTLESHGSFFMPYLEAGVSVLDCGFGVHLEAAGFEAVRMAARYECYPSLAFIGEYLALQLERAGDAPSAAVFRAWSRRSGGMSRKPGSLPSR